MISGKGKNLVFIFSLPRSGSTLLSAILGNHSSVYCPPEPWILLRLSEVYGNAAENKIYDDYVAGQAVKAFLNENEFINSARAFAQTSYNSLLTKTGHQLFVDKTPRYYHILDFIETLFPEAKKIWLKRNPLDVAASYKITWNRGIDFLVGEILDPTSFDFILGLPNLEKFFAEKSPEKLEIKYEDLVHCPEQEIKKIAAFCNIQFEPSMLDLSESRKGLKIVLNSEFGDKKIKDRQQFDSSSIDYWEKHLKPNEIKKLTGFIGSDIFVRMGYEETVTGHPEFFDLTIGKEVIKKAQDKILENFQHIKPLQMAHIYDLETQIRKYQEEIQEIHKQCAKLTANLNEERFRFSDLKQKNIWLQEQLQIIRQELEEKEILFEKERDHWDNAFKEQEERLATIISEYQEKLDLAESNYREIEAAFQPTRAELQQKKEQEERLATIISEYQEKLDLAESNYREIETAFQQTRSELQQKEEQYHKTRYSYSYQIGRALLFVFIKIRAWIRRND